MSLLFTAYVFPACPVVAAMGDDVKLWVNYPCKSESRGPGSVSFEVDNGLDQVRKKRTHFKTWISLGTWAV